MNLMFGPVDLTILIVYVLGVVVFGSYFLRRSKTTEGFTVGSRALPGWAVGLSILGTYLSSMTFLGFTGKAYATNWNFFIFALTLPVAAAFAVTCFLPIYRRAGLVSAYEFLEERLGLGGRTYAGVCFILLQVVRVGVILYLVAVAMAPFLGWELYQLILVAGVLITLYTVLGGIEAVIWTDVIQVVVLVAGALFCAVVLLFFSFETPGQLFTVARASDKFSFGSWDAELATSTVWTVLIYGIAENLKNFGVDQNYIQRFVSAESDRAASRSLWLGSLSYIPLAALFFFIGASLFAYYQVHPELLPAEIRSQSDSVFPYFIQQRLPVGVRGVLIAAILAAAMSTVDSSLNSASTIGMVDFYRRRIRPDANDRQCLRVVRLLTVLLGLVGTALGLSVIVLVQYKDNVIDVWWELAGIIGGPFLGLFLLAVLARPMRGSSLLISLIAGAVMIAWVTFSPQFPESMDWIRCRWHVRLAGPAGTVVMLLTGLVLAGFRATQPPAVPSPISPPTEKVPAHPNEDPGSTS